MLIEFVTPYSVVSLLLIRYVNSGFVIAVNKHQDQQGITSFHSFQYLQSQSLYRLKYGWLLCFTSNIKHYVHILISVSHN